MKTEQLVRATAATAFSVYLQYLFTHLFIYLKCIRDDRLKSVGWPVEWLLAFHLFN